MSEVVVARTQYDPRPVFASDLDFAGDKGLTKQSDSKDCDINLLFKRFERTGQLPEMIVRDGRYGDFSSVPDFQAAHEIVRHAEEQFMNLDAPVRNRFDNDPVKFLAFVSDPKNEDEMEKMGLLNKEALDRRAAARAKAAADASAKDKTESDKAFADLVAKVKAAL